MRLYRPMGWRRTREALELESWAAVANWPESGAVTGTVTVSTRPAAYDKARLEMSKIGLNND